MGALLSDGHIEILQVPLNLPTLFVGLPLFFNEFVMTLTFVLT